MLPSLVSTYSITNQPVWMIVDTDPQPTRLQALLGSLALSRSLDEVEERLEDVLWPLNLRAGPSASVYSEPAASSPGVFSDARMNPFGLCRTLPS